MCDCFHVVLPTWPGAPGSVSGRQLQPEEPGTATEEDRSVTEEPEDEIIRPRPQGSSPVYECTTEAAGFAVQEDAPGRQGSSGRRRSWWKRDSADSRVFSRMSHPEAGQEMAEVTMETEVEAGASGYSVTGGGHQGIFVKQVLKDSAAAKLFSLREGDQLLSATIFFDDIKYEDALKILQYSEPYKIQFKIRRKLPATKSEESAVCAPPRGSRGRDQHRDMAEECTETPTKMPEADGDRERLIAKPRMSRGRRPQERLSWPKFQAVKGKRGPGPRRSHSSSEAHEPGDAPHGSPTRADTEARLPGELQEQKAGPGRQRRKFLNFRLQMGSGQDPSAQGHLGKGAQGRPHPPGVLEDTGAAAGGKREGTAQSEQDTTSEPPAQQPTELGLPAHDLGDRAPGEGAGVAARGQGQTQQVEAQQRGATRSHPRPGTDAGPQMGWAADLQEVGGLEMGTARQSLMDTGEPGSTQAQPPGTQVQIREVKPPKSGISKQKVPETERGSKGFELRRRTQTSPGQDDGGRTQATAGKDRSAGIGPNAHGSGKEEGTEQTPETLRETAQTQEGKDRGRREAKIKMPRFKMSSLGWSPTREAAASQSREGQEEEDQRRKKGQRENAAPHMLTTDTEEKLTQEEEPESILLETTWKGNATTETHGKKRDREAAGRDSKFKVPKFKMPSFGVSTPSKSLDRRVEVKAEEALPSIREKQKHPDVSIQLPTADLDDRAGQVGMTVPEPTMPEGELAEARATGRGLKGHFPKVQMPKVELKGPQVDAKGPKVEVSMPDVDVEMPSVQVDIQAPDTRLEGDLAMADKEVSTKDSKFKMPKFKMPSFGMTAPGKGLDASLEVKAPKMEADVALPSVQGDVKGSDLSIQLPSTDRDARAGQGGVTLPEATLPEGHLPEGPAAETGLKGHLPNVQVPSITMPKVDLKGPQVHIKGPKLGVKGAKGEVSTPAVDVEMPSLQVDVQAPDAKLEGDLTLAEKDVSTRDSKFKMPKFKMPSFGVSAPAKGLDVSVKGKMPVAETEQALPSMQGDLKSSDLTIQLPSADLDASTVQVGVTLPETTMPEGQLPDVPVAGARLEGHLPKLQMPSIKMPKVDLKGPQVDIKGPKVDAKGPKVEVSMPDVDVEMSSVKVDIQAADTKLEGDLALAEKEVSTKDSKFKMPKFKMPSFGVSSSSKDLDASVEVKAPEMEAVMALPSAQGDIKGSDLSIQLPSTDLDARAGEVDVTLPEATLSEGELPEAWATGHGLKKHFPKVQMPKVELKGPQVDIKGPKVDAKGPKVEVSMSDVDVEMPSVQVDIQAPDTKLEGDLALADKDVSTKDSKFKMPKFKMPSFGVSAPAKGLDMSVKGKMPVAETEQALPSMQGDLKSSDLTIQLPSADLDASTVQVGVTLPETTMPEGQLPDVPVAGARLEGHLPKLQMPSIKMPKVDLKGRQVDIKGPKVDGKGSKVEVGMSDVDVEMPSVQVDIQAPDTKLEGDLALADKDVSTKDSKFKMPKFKMPSFGVSSSSKDLDASLEVKAPKMEAVVALPSAQGDIKGSDLSIQLPSTDLDARAGQVDVRLPDATLPKGELPEARAKGRGFKGHFPKVQMHKVELKGPQVDIKGPKVDTKGPKVEVGMPDVEVEMPSVQVDIQAPDTKLEGDLALADKDMSTKDSKFKMPKFKMPSFGLTAPGKGLDASLEVKAPKMEADVALPSVQGDVKGSDLSIQLPSTDLDARAGQGGVTLPEATLPEGHLPEGPAAETGLKGHLPNVQVPSITMPKVDLKGPQVHIKGPKLGVKGAKGEVSTPAVDVEMPSLQVDVQAPDAKLEGDLTLAEKDVSTRDSKFKMPKFKMPSFGVSAPAKGLDVSVKDKMPVAETEQALPSMQGDLKSSDLTIQLPSADLDASTVQVGVTLPETTMPEGQLPDVPVAGARLEGHLPKLQMPSIKMPKVDLKGPQVDIKGPKVDAKGPKVEVSMPDMDVEMSSVKVDIQAADTKLEGDLALAEKEVSTKDSKFKMPKFKMSSFGVSSSSKDLDASLEVKAPEMEADVALPSAQGDIKGSDLSIQLPSTDLDARAGEVDVTLPESTLPEGELPEAGATGRGLKKHFPKVQMPKVELKGPQVDIKGPKVDAKGPKVEVSMSDVDVEMPSVQVDIQAPDTKLEGDLALADKDVSTKDSKFKMPKFKMPSFGVSSSSKDLDASLEVKAPKLEADMALPSMQGDLKSSDLTIQLPSADLDASAVQVGVTLPETTMPEGQLPDVPVAGARLDGHLPKLQMPSIKIPKVDLKGPQVDIKGPKADGKGPKVEVGMPDVDVEMPSVQVDIQVPDTKLEGDLALADKDVSTKDSKFKMPKFKMSSFGVSSSSKDLDASLEVKAPKMEAVVALPSAQGDIKGSDLSIQLPSTDLDARAGQVDVRLPDATLPGGELPEARAKGRGLKGHFPKVQMPKVELKGPQVDIKGPKVDAKGPKVEVGMPDVEVEMPSVQVDIQAPDTRLEGDLALADKDMSTKDSKFKMPKFKMPSFGLTAPGKGLDASLEVKAPKMEADVALPSVQGDVKGSDLSIQLPSTDLDARAGQGGVTLPEATLPEGHLPEGPAAETGLKGHLPKVQVPSITMPKVDLKGPQVHIKGPKLGVKGAKGEVSTPAVDVEMPSLQVDVQAPDAKLEGDLTLAEKDVSTRDSKFKMPKFKMSSFGVSAPAKGLDVSVKDKMPVAETEQALPSMQGDLKSSDLTIQLPSADLDASAVQVGVTLPETTMPEGQLPDVPVAGARLEGHLPKLQMPSIKMPKVDLKGPQVDIKGPKVDAKGPKVEVSMPDMDVEMSSVKVDIQAADTKLEGDLALAEKEVSTKDSKFKMPKFKMPSFGVSSSSKDLDASLEVKAPEMEAVMALPSAQGDIKGSDLSIQLPSTDLDARAGEVDVTLPESTLPEGELPEAGATGRGLKKHFPKVQMPKVELKGPQVDIKGPKVDAKGPKVEVSMSDVDVEMPSVQVDIQAPDTKLEGDLALADKDVSTKDSKFKMPKFKMPSFGVSSSSKDLDASLEVKAPKLKADMALPSMQGDLKSSDLTIQLPSADLDASAVQVGVTLPETTMPEGQLPDVPVAGARLEGHLPKLQMPSIKMPKVDLKGPQVDIKGPKVDAKGPKVEVSMPDMDVEMSSVKVDIQAADTKLEGDLALAEKEVSTKDSKFKMPKFKMPSFGVSSSSKDLDASLEVKAPEMEAVMALPSAQGDIKGSDLSIQLPSTDLDARAGQVDVRLPDATLPKGELPEARAKGRGFKGHFPKVQMPKVELKGPQVDIKGPKVDAKGPKVEVSMSDVDVEMPSVQVDIQAPDTKLEGDLALADKDVSTKDSKFKMPKFKMPSFGVSSSSKDLDASLEVKAPKLEADMALPSMQGDLKSSDLTIQLPSADLDTSAVQVGVTLPETTMPEGQLPDVPVAGARLEGHLPKLQMPSIKIPKVDLKGPQVDIKGPKVDGKGPKVEVSMPDMEVEMPSVQVDIQAPDTKLEGDMALADKDVSTKDSKFKMPKFKMPSFGVSSSSKDMDASLEVKAPKMEADVALPSAQGDIKGSDLTIQLPSTDLDARARQVDVTLSEATLREGELPEARAKGRGLKGHFPKVQMPKVELKGPQVDIKGPKVDAKGPKVEVGMPDVEVEMPSVQVDIQAPDTKLEGDLALAEKDVSTKDSKFKMPKFKMSSFGVSSSSKDLDASLEVKAPKMEADVALPSVHVDFKGSDLSIQLPSTDLDASAGQVGVTLPEATLPEGELPEAGATGSVLKGHFPKVQMPKVELKGPQVDAKGPKMEVGMPDVEVEMPSVQVDIQAPDTKLEGDLALADKDVSTKDSKFKMPKFKMPSFGLTAPGKGLDASLEVKAPKMEADVALPSVQGDVKGSDLSIQLPSTDLDARAGQGAVTLPEATLPEGHLPEGPAAETGLKGHLPKVQVPSITMPKVDLKGPQVHIKGPKLGVKGAKGEVSTPAVDVEMPSLQVDVQAPDAKLEGDLTLAEKDVSTRDSKFKMPKFKMPSFGVSAPAKGLDVSVKGKMPVAETEQALPSMQGDLKSSDLTIQLPSADLDASAVQVGVTLPEATMPEGQLPDVPVAGARLDGHLPKLQMPSIKMPKVDLKGPQVDIKGPKADGKGPKVEVGMPDVDVEMPSVQVDIQAPDTKLEGDLALADKDVSTKDSKFKMPKFKMPSFSVSSSSKDLDASLEVKAPKMEAVVALPSAQGDIKGSDLSIQLPSTDLDARAGQVGVTLPEATLPEGELPEARAKGRGLKGHFPKVQMPKVELKGPQVDIKGPKVDAKGPKVEVSMCDVDVEMPSVQVDIQAPDTKLEGHLALADKDVSTKDSKFKMPKFKMPSFGVSSSSKDLDASLEVKVPKVEADVALPFVQGDIKSSDLTIQLPSADLDASAVQVGVTLPETTMPEGRLPDVPVVGARLDGHLPKLQMPSIKMPRVDLKGSQVDIKGPQVDGKGPKVEVGMPDVDVEMPSMQVDIQAPDTKLEGDLALADKDVSTKDSKFTALDSSMSFQKKELESKFQRPHFKFSQFSLPHKKCGEDSVVLDEGSGVSLLRVSPRPSSDSVCGESQEPSMSWATSSVDVPSFAQSDLPPARADSIADHPEDAVFPGSADPTQNHTLGTLLLHGAGAECPQSSFCSSQHSIPSPGFESSAVLREGTVTPVFALEHQPGSEDTLLPAFHARVTFPKFHKPKFGFSSALAVDAQADAPVADSGKGLSLPSPAERAHSSGQPATVASLPASQSLSLGVPVFPVMEEQLGPPLLRAPAEGADHDGKDSPFKMPRLKLPTFSWSSKKEAMATGFPGDHPEDSTLSLVLEPDQRPTQHGVPIPQTEAQTARPPEKEGEKERLRRPGFALPRLSLPKLRRSQEGVPPGDEDAPFSSTAGGCDSEATEKASYADGGMKFGLLDGGEGPSQVPQSPVPNLSACTAKVELRLSEADLGLPTRDRAVRDDRRERGLGDISESQSPGQRTAPTPAPQDTALAESREEGTAAGGPLADPRERRLATPSAHAAQACVPAVPAPAEPCSDPGSKEETSVSPRSSEAETEVTTPRSQSHAAVPSGRLERPGLRLPLSAVPLYASGPGARTHPTEDSLPLQTPSVRPSERQAPPAKVCGEPLPRPGGCDLVQAEARAEKWALPPEGPLKLKASSTDLPSQVSVVSVDQLWEDSVLTVTFPKLKVPRFSFPVSSSEADVFFPVVRDVPCVEASAEAALLQERPGIWGASLLRAIGSSGPGERPEGPNLSLEAPPVSKVRVHIQESRGESQGITVCSRVAGAYAGLGAPKAFSTQVVRESEIPASTVQMPSYGFSSLKAKIPEPPAQASTYTLSQDSGAWEHPGGAPGGDADPGEPFEVITASANPPGPQAFASEVCSGLQLADSGSDEEPAEILEFPSDGSLEATPRLAGEDRAPKEKPEGKKPSGLFWSWLPNIGFSSIDEPGAEAGDDARRSAPIQTQPGARSDPEPPRKQERAGWFRFPRLGFSSSPAKKSKSAEAEAGLAERKLQEEAATFFDARESFSPEEEEDEEAAGAVGARLGSGVVVVSSARTELTLPEHSRSAGAKPVPRPKAE